MKLKFFAVLAGAALAAAGCVSTVSDTHTFASTWGRDTLSNRYLRPMDPVYQAAVTVIQNSGTLTREFITPGTNNIPIRSLSGKVNQSEVWVRVEAVDSKTTQVDEIGRAHV